VSASARQRLVDALDASLQAGRPARFWLRDDDAVTPTPALERLLSTAARHRLPATIAAIPSGVEAALGARLVDEPDVRVAVHGWTHRNHAPPGEKKQELGGHRPREIVAAELDAGLRRIVQVFAEKARPVLVPPWNRIDAALLPSLPGLGYAAVSVFGPPRPGPLRAINTSVDIIDWHGTRGGRPLDSLFAEVAAQVDGQRADEASQAIGVLTHHLVHDETAWSFIEMFGEITSGRADWQSIDTLLGGGAGQRPEA
jgi:peptidoglycan/xylan/chitin deacetylase (PgdA/CDA1 family)